MTVVIREADTGGVRSFRFDAIIDGGVRGSINVVRAPKRIHGHIGWVVRGIHVDADRRRQRIGTQLYAAAAREACRRRGQLVSTSNMRNPHAHSHDFWVKQARLGQAQVFADGTYALPCPVTTLARPRSRR